MTSLGFEAEPILLLVLLLLVFRLLVPFTWIDSLNGERLVFAFVISVCTEDWNMFPGPLDRDLPFRPLD